MDDIEGEKTRLDGCRLADWFLGEPSHCERGTGRNCPFGACIYDLVDDKADEFLEELVDILIKAKRENGEGS